MYFGGLPGRQGNKGQINLKSSVAKGVDLLFFPVSVRVQ